MTAGPARYQAQALHSESQGVKTYLGVDPVTGLPVLIYRFASPLRAGIELLDSPFMLRILAYRHDDSGGLIVAAFSSAYIRASAGQQLTATQLLDSAQALEAASALDLPHGSIRADRFLLAGDTLLIEGFGVPWQRDGSATLADDVRDWALAVGSLGYPANAAVDALLQRASADDPAARPGAAELVLILTAALAPAAPAVAVSPEPGPAAAEPAEAEPELAAAPDPEFELESELETEFETEFDWATLQLPGELDRETFTASGTENAAGTARSTGIDSASEEAPLLQPAGQPPEPRKAVNLLEAIEIDFSPSAQFSSERLLQQRQEVSAASAARAAAVSAAAAHAVTARLGDVPATDLPLQDAPAVPGAADGADPGIPAISLPSAQRSASGGRPSFVKDLPPGSTYRTGSVTAQPRQTTAWDGEPPLEPEPAGKRRRSGMIAALVILTAVLAGLALYSRGLLPFNQAPAVTAPLVTYIVDVQVEPADLPPVTLYVLESPAGSALRAGTIVGTAPRKIALDRPGNWVFEGRFQGQASGPVAIQVPEERNRVVLINIPPAQPQD
jgi:hypothetical protein